MEDSAGRYFECNASSVLSKKNSFSSHDGISEDVFWCIIELCSVRSNKVIKALYEYIVLKHSRSVSCNNNGVSNGYFGSCLARVEHVVQVINRLNSCHKEISNKKAEI